MSSLTENIKDFCNKCRCPILTLFSVTQVVPALVARLPLKEDMEENKTVFNCLARLYTHSPALVQNTAGHQLR